MRSSAQHVTCRIALVAAGSCFNSWMAFLVGRINNLILRRLASCFTSSITGKAPVPVPITSRRHFQGDGLLLRNRCVSEGRSGETEGDHTAGVTPAHQNSQF